MRTKLLLLILAFLAVSIETRAQTEVVSSFNAVLNSTCSNATTACAGTATPVTGQIGLTGPALEEVTGYFNSSTITVSGTYSGATINFEFSDASGGGGVNYFSMICARTDINLLENSEVLPTNQLRAWNCPAWAVNRIRIRLSALTSGAVNVTMTLSTVAVDPSLVIAASQTNIAGASDPCYDTSALKSSAPITIAAAATTQQIALAAGKSIYVCGGVLDIQGSATTVGSIQLEYGTGTNCAGGPTALTGVMPGNITANVPTIIPITPGLTTPSGQELCTIAAGTTVGITGYLVYVQQ